MSRILYDINMDGILWLFGVLKSLNLELKDQIEEFLKSNSS